MEPLQMAAEAFCMLAMSLCVARIGPSHLVFLLQLLVLAPNGPHSVPSSSLVIDLSVNAEFLRNRPAECAFSPPIYEGILDGPDQPVCTQTRARPRGHQQM